MDFNVPKKFSIGSVDYNVKQLDYVNHGEDFGVWRCSGDIELANNISGDKVSESKKKQTFWYELTHAILFQMSKFDLNDDESFVNTFSSFLSEAINSME